MKTGKIFISVISLFCAPAFAGWPVTDPISYTYYVQQLKQMVNTYKTSVEQLSKAKELNGQVRSMESQLKGVYNQASGFANELKRAKELTEGVPATMANTAREFARNAESLKDTVENPFEDARLSLDALFTDPRIKGVSDKTDHDRRYYARQSAVRDSIVTADGLLKQMPDNFAHIDELARRIDGTSNVKESQDLTNRLLVEVLKTLTQLLIVDARLTHASGLMNYQGVSEDATKERLKKLEGAAQYAAQEGFLEQLHNKYAGADFTTSFYNSLNKLKD